jgi:hypothetical protein
MLQKDKIKDQNIKKKINDQTCNFTY